MALVERLTTIWYRVRDLHDAREFYTTVLGLAAPALAEGEDCLELETGGDVRLALSTLGPEDLHGGGVPVFAVADLPAALAALRDSAATVEPLPATDGRPGGAPGAYVYDPTGNRLQLAQAPAAATTPPSAAGLVAGIDFIWNLTLYPEWEAAHQFLRDTLGLTETFSATDPHWAIFDTGSSTRLALGTPEDDQFGPAGAWVAVLEVHDMDAMLAHLRHHAIEHTEEEGDPGGRLVSLDDPDGNALQLHWTAPES